MYYAISLAPNDPCLDKEKLKVIRRQTTNEKLQKLKHITSFPSAFLQTNRTPCPYVSRHTTVPEGMYTRFCFKLALLTRVILYYFSVHQIYPGGQYIATCALAKNFDFVWQFQLPQNLPYNTSHCSYGTLCPIRFLLQLPSYMIPEPHSIFP